MSEFPNYDPQTPQSEAAQPQKNKLPWIIGGSVLFLCCCCAVMIPTLIWLWNNGDQLIGG